MGVRHAVANINRAAEREAPVKHTAKKTTQAAKAHPVVEWTFQRGTEKLTCQVAKACRHAYSVLLVPHWNVGGAAVESFGEFTTALQRHATIAAELRENGWTVRAYTA